MRSPMRTGTCLATLECATCADAPRHEHLSAFLLSRANERTPKLVAWVNERRSTEVIAVSFVTLFEVRRGLETVIQAGGGSRKLVAFEKFIDGVRVIGLDDPAGGGWNLAARLWAAGTAIGRKFTDADLLIAATAAFHAEPFATSDKGLAEGLQQIKLPVPVHLLQHE